MKRYIPYILVIVLIYLGASVINSDFNAFLWKEDNKIAMFVIMFQACFFIALFKRDLF